LSQPRADIVFAEKEQAASLRPSSYLCGSAATVLARGDSRDGLLPNQLDANKGHTHFSNDFASANGATSTPPGAAPRVADATFEEGLKARLNRGFLTDRKIESGLQPSNHFTPSTRGVAPGGVEVAPLALETTR